MQDLKIPCRGWLRSAIVLLATTFGCGAATTIWNANLTFNEFAGQPGGFEAGTSVIHNGAVPDPVVRHYDVLRPTGMDAASGKAVYGTGQDGTTDLTIRTQVINGFGGRWASAYAGKRPTGYNGGATIVSGTSRSGDWSLVAMEFRFAPGLGVTADQFALGLTSANGTSEAYEWTMITLGGMADAPFTKSQFASYQATDYSAMGSSTYYNALGGLTGQAGTGQRLATGRSISQFLAGAPAAPVSGGMVREGWYAVDDFNARVFDGPEADWDNPYADDGAVDDNLQVTGRAMGLDDETLIQSFTVWMGVYDVGFDSNGDGFTSTDGNPFVSISGLSVGSTPEVAGVPEPGVSGLGLILAGWLGKRARGRRG